jgi:predicted dehydrogenase
MLAEAPEFQLVAIVDPVVERRRRLRKERLAGRRVVEYDHHEAMLEEVRPEAVVVSTPHTLHFRHALDALRAGAHVMVEKPMVTNSAHARKLVAVAERVGKVFQVAIQGTHTDTFAYARKLLEDGTMGPLQLVTGVLAQDWLEPTRGSWRQVPRLSGGGELYDSTSHVLSAMLYLVNSPPVEAFCWADPKDTRVDVNAVGCIRFQNGCMGTITSGGNCGDWRSHLILQGRKALMDISAHGGDFRVTGAGLKTPITQVPPGWKTPTVSPIRNFADSILGKDTPRCPGRIGIMLADLMGALFTSAASGRPARIPASRSQERGT